MDNQTIIRKLLNRQTEKPQTAKENRLFADYELALTTRRAMNIDSSGMLLIETNRVISEC
jgi:hypothetical protein